MEDLADLMEVEISISFDGKKLWVNGPNGCVLRIQGIGRLILNDARKK